MGSCFKTLLFISCFGLLFLLDCTKNDSKDIKIENKKTFDDSIWVFGIIGDTIKDEIIGMWLSQEVSYDDKLCYDCDSLFTWVIESNGKMVKRNNNFGDNETRYGDWTLDDKKEFILFSYELPKICGTCKSGSETNTDTIRIIYSNSSELWSSEFINYPPTTKLGIKFMKILK